MTDMTDIEPILDDWFADGSDVLPDRSVDAVLAAVQQTGQRGAWRAPWRTSPMNRFSHPTLLAGAAAIVAVAIVGVFALSGQRPARDATRADRAPKRRCPYERSDVRAGDADARSSLTGTIVYRLQLGDGSDRAYAMALPSGTSRPLGLHLLSRPRARPALGHGDRRPPTRRRIVTFAGNPVEGPWQCPPDWTSSPMPWCAAV